MKTLQSIVWIIMTFIAICFIVYTASFVVDGYNGHKDYDQMMDELENM